MYILKACMCIYVKPHLTLHSKYIRIILLTVVSDLYNLLPRFSLWQFRLDRECRIQHHPHHCMFLHHKTSICIEDVSQNLLHKLRKEILVNLSLCLQSYSITCALHCLSISFWHSDLETFMDDQLLKQPQLRFS